MFAFILILLAFGAALMYDSSDSEESEAGALFLSLLTIFIVGGLLAVLFITLK